MRAWALESAKATYQKQIEYKKSLVKKYEKEMKEVDSIHQLACQWTINTYQAEINAYETFLEDLNFIGGDEDAREWFAPIEV